MKSGALTEDRRDASLSACFSCSSSRRVFFLCSSLRKCLISSSAEAASMARFRIFSNSSSRSLMALVSSAICRRSSSFAFCASLTAGDLVFRTDGVAAMLGSSSGSSSMSSR
ncbi:hypothetical protein BJY04DRAFT_178868 [Aspergillus karnatakaensis]|uniref:uncharacterized protein n=1 Tax=Aspergillus karnatakaensis TaxID=1810916 RepID=UPI003CCD6F52